jgi:hyaluronoglucosaminidase
VPRPVPLRGVIEGFYGPPWSFTDRLAVIEFLAERGMNAYVYAPKSDPKHRDHWREAYDVAETAEFRTLVEHATRQGTRFGFALSPGLDIDYRGARDHEALLRKLAPLLDAGVEWIVLALDDVPNRPGLAPDQVHLTAWLVDALRARQADIHLTLVPTEYVGTRPTSYLGDLAAGLPPQVDVMWTGPTVCSPVVRAADARAWATALAGRRPLLWDNYPVNDGTMERSLHLGPYRGREPELTDELDGVLCNPMLQPRASQVALATAADFLCGPESYEPAVSWSRAIAAVGRSRAPALRATAAACADGPLLPPEHLEAHSLITTLVDAIGAPGWPDAVRALRDHFTAVREAGRAFDDAEDDPLAAELEPWLASATVEAEAGLAALRLVQQCHPVGWIDRDGNGKAFSVDAELAMVHAFAAVFSWSAARRAKHVVFGPRFAFYPAVVQLDDGRPGLDVDLAVVEDQSAIDRLCRFALAHYQAWTTRSRDSLRVRVDGAPVAVESDGGFSGRGAEVVVVEAGPDATEVSGAASTLPFPDPRLS